MRDGRGNSEIHFTRLLSQGLVRRSDDFAQHPLRVSRPYKATTKSRKRDVSARYSALQDPHPPPPNSILEFGQTQGPLPPNLGEVPKAEGVKAGGTTRRPLVLQMDRGRILFRTGGATC